MASAGSSSLPPSPPLLVLERSDYATKEVTLLRDKALALAGNNQLELALPLFEAICQMNPTEVQYHSDLGVTWMRLGEWTQAWGSFGRALVLEPLHALARQNRDELRAFLGDSHPVVMSNNLSPPRRAPHAREHSVSPLPRLPQLPPADQVHWWRAPFVLSPPSAAGSAASPADLDRSIIAAVQNATARYFPGGRAQISSIGVEHSAVGTMRRLQSRAARAGHAVSRVPLRGDVDAFVATLAGLNASRPPFDSHNPSVVVPSGACAKSLDGGGTRAALEHFLTRRALTLSASPGATDFLHRELLGIAHWSLQLRGTSRWTLCNGSPAVSASQLCGVSSSYHYANNIDVLDPNYNLCPAFKNASCLDAELSPGESIYIPPPWWMQAHTTSAEGSAAVSSGLLTREGAHKVGQRIRELCDKSTWRPDSWNVDEWGVKLGAHYEKGEAGGPLVFEAKGAKESLVGICKTIGPCLDEWATIKPLAPTPVAASPLAGGMMGEA